PQVLRPGNRHGARADSQGAARAQYPRVGAHGVSASGIEAHGLAKAYSEGRALEALDLAVAPGVVLGFLGPNGAGKTTAIRMLTTVLKPDEGTFTIAGIPHTKPVEIRQRVGVLPESAGYPERQSSEEFLRYHARLFGHTRESARETTRSLLAETGLTERGRSPVGGDTPRARPV